MKCLVCDAQIDENKAFPVTIGPQGQKIEDIMGQWNHAQALASWTHVALTAQYGGGTMMLLSGHICPAHPVKVGCVFLVASKLAAPPAASSPDDVRPATKGKDKP